MDSKKNPSNERRVFMRMSAVTAATGYAKSTIWKKVKEGSFPPPIHLSDAPGGAVAWPSDVVEHWIAERIERSQKASER